MSPASEDLFEGPEKKLHVTFYKPIVESCGAPSDLRLLSRAQIETVTDAANCTILSHVSNDSIDAYLLSESSLFVTSNSMTLKTCGTTTLLYALDIIIGLGQSMGMCPARVTFTRVAYLFPQRQLYPHTNFDTEVSYLDMVLSKHGTIFRNTLDVSTHWYCYIASFQPTGHFSEVIPTSTSNTFEIAMYDLDPREMRQFMFHSDPSRIGSDDVETGTTARAGILPLLSQSDAIDAYNFAPCGYSLNAVAPKGAYYTIHATPEDGASYISYEATVGIDNPAHLIASVVRTFRPSRFTVSLTSIAACSGEQPAELGDIGNISWNIVDKLLYGTFLSDGSPNVRKFKMPTCNVSTVVASYHIASEFNIIAMPKAKALTPPSLSDDEFRRWKHGTQDVLTRVAKKHGAKALQRGALLMDSSLKPVLSPVQADSVHPPTLVVDLAQVTRNYMQIRDIGCRNVELRHIVHCCADVAVLELLAGFKDIVFEVADATEVGLLSRLGVCKQRMVLRVRVASSSVLGLLKSVGGILLHDVPDLQIAAAIQRSQVTVDLLMVADETENVHQLVSTTQALTKGKVRAVGFLGAEVCAYSTRCCGRYLQPQTGNASAVNSAIADAVATSEGSSIVVDVSQSLVDKAVSVVLSVIGQRLRPEVEDLEGRVGYENPRQFCYVNDGMYGIFSALWLSEGGDVRGRLVPRMVDGSNDKCNGDECIGGEKCMRTTVWGPTCDAFDRVWDGLMPKIKISDRVVFDNIGAFSVNSVTRFNGFSGQQDCVYVMSDC